MNKMTRIISGLVGLVVIAGAVYIYSKNTPPAAEINSTNSTEVDEEGEPAAMDEGGYNSSRSNKPRPVAQPDKETDVAEDTASSSGRQEAQDYNSSRSNKPSPTAKDNE